MDRSKKLKIRLILLGGFFFMCALCFVIMYFIGNSITSDTEGVEQKQEQIKKEYDHLASLYTEIKDFDLQTIQECTISSEDILDQNIVDLDYLEDMQNYKVDNDGYWNFMNLNSFSKLYSIEEITYNMRADNVLNALKDINDAQYIYVMIGEKTKPLIVEGGESYLSGTYEGMILVVDKKDSIANGCIYPIVYTNSSRVKFTKDGFLGDEGEQDLQKDLDTNFKASILEAFR